MTLGLINYGSGNYASVLNALRYLKVPTLEVLTPGDCRRASHLILPGVGSFAAAMNRLREMDLVRSLEEEVLVKEKPFLGICVGMQVLARWGHEFEVCPGLGFLEGDTVELAARSMGLRSPHMGWNPISTRQESPLLRSLGDPPISFYFAHGYHLVPKDRSVVVATARYGEEIAACVQVKNILGVQFHPEKSQQAGLALLQNFARLPAAGR